jgi:hypothetical protein
MINLPKANLSSPTAQMQARFVEGESFLAHFRYYFRVLPLKWNQQKIFHGNGLKIRLTSKSLFLCPTFRAIGLTSPKALICQKDGTIPFSEMAFHSTIVVSHV